MNKEEIIKKLEKYNFDKEEYILISSGSMVMQGLKESAKDLDIAVSSKLCGELIKKYNPEIHEYEMDGEKIKYYSFDDFDFSINNYQKEDRIFTHGIPVQNINSLLKFKKGLLRNLNREKDKKDIILIKNYLKNLNINVLALAYIGDAVYEIYIRDYLLSKNIVKVNELQKESVKYVSAKAQSKFLSKMIEEKFLNEEELSIIKRARNNKGKSHPKNTDIITYKYATGIEALIGFHHLNKNKKREEEIMNYIIHGGN